MKRSPTLAGWPAGPDLGSQVKIINQLARGQTIFWDENSTENPTLAWDMIQVFHDLQLSLVNDESVPTFYRANNRPQVLDLIWLSDDAFGWHGTQVVYDIFGADVDHKNIMLRFGSQQNITLENSHLLRTYIPSGSEEEEHLVFFVFDSMGSWTAASPNGRAQQMIDAFQDGWQRFAKPGRINYNRWWDAAARLPNRIMKTVLPKICAATFLPSVNALRRSTLPKKLKKWSKAASLGRVLAGSNSEHCPRCHKSSIMAEY